MEIREEMAGEVLVLAPDGDLSAAENCHALEQRLSAAVSAGTRLVVVDCAQVGHLTSPALRALLLTSRKLARAGGRLVLCGMTAKVQKAFAISGFDRDFSVVPARHDAIGTAREPPARPAAAKASAKPAPALAAREAAIPSPASSAAPAPSAASAPPAPSAAPASGASPDPRLAVALRLLVALGSAAADAAPRADATSPDAAAARDRLVAALVRAFDVHPA
jgi:anti-anti-sigma factor